MSRGTLRLWDRFYCPQTDGPGQYTYAAMDIHPDGLIEIWPTDKSGERAPDAKTVDVDILHPLTLARCEVTRGCAQARRALECAKKVRGL
jgi:hypothetical protein